MCLLYNFLHITVEIRAVLEGGGFKPNYFGKTRDVHYSSSGMQVLSGLSRSQTDPVLVLQGSVGTDISLASHLQPACPEARINCKL